MEFKEPPIVELYFTVVEYSNSEIAVDKVLKDDKEILDKFPTAVEILEIPSLISAHDIFST